MSRLSDRIVRDYPVGSRVRVTYRNGGEKRVTTTGTVIDGRYPHLYLNVEVVLPSGQQDTLSIPMAMVPKVVSR